MTKQQDLTPAKLDPVFARLERCALNGERCPRTSGPDAESGIESDQIVALARAGRVLIEIYAHNWRVITILTGPNKGRKTAPTPYKGQGKPYQVVGKDGSIVNGKFTDHGAASRKQPWSPPRL